MWPFSNRNQDKELEEIIYMADKKDPIANARLMDLFDRERIDSERLNEIRRKIYLPLAQKGDVEAQKWMGLLSRNPDESLMWYRSAAEQGDTAAMKAIAMGYGEYANDPSLGSVAHYGKDLQKEFSWNLRAAEAGDGEAQVCVGREYAIGTVVEKDIVKEEMWYRRAVNSGYLPACEPLAKLYDTPAAINGQFYAPDKAEQLYLKAMESHNESVCSAAAFSLGIRYGTTWLYNVGPSPKDDANKSLYWLYQAVWFGFGSAQESIDKLCRKTGIHPTKSQLENWHNEFLARV